LEEQNTVIRLKRLSIVISNLFLDLNNPKKKGFN